MERNRFTIIAGSVALGCLAVFMINAAMHAPAQPPAPSSSSPPTSTEEQPGPTSLATAPANDDDAYKWATLSKQKMDEGLKDPQSAQYKDTHNYKLDLAPGKTAYAVCGEVNAKNEFGGYTGFKRFMASPIVAVVDGQANADFEDIWTKICDPAHQMYQSTGW